MSFHYKDIVPWGRSFDEYLDMFNLSEDDLARDIVDVVETVPYHLQKTGNQMLRLKSC